MRKPVTATLRTAILTVVAGVGFASSAVAQRRVALDTHDAHLWALVLATHDTRSQDTAAIDSALSSPVAPLRAFAARVVGLNRIMERYANLRGLLRTDPDTAVRRDAAFAIGLATDTASCGVLRDALSRSADGDAAAWAIGEMSGRCGDFASTLALASSHATRSALFRVAGKWTPFPDSAVSAALTRTRDVDERSAALYSFGRARRSAGAPFALAASRDTSATVRELGARLLAASIQRPEDSVVTVSRLGALLHDRDPHVRIAAVRSLTGFHGAARTLLEHAWPSEHDANVRVTMAQSAGAVAADTAAIWSIWWRSDSTHSVRRSLIASAWSAGAILALGGAAGGALESNPDFRIRIAMIDGAAAKNIEASARTIALRWTDGDPRVRAAVISALARASLAIRDSIGWTAMRDAAIADEDVGVRQAALGSFVRTATAVTLPLALQGYRRALTDTSGDARETALDLVAAIWKNDSVAVTDSLVQALHALPPSPDRLLRQRVAAVTPLAHWRQPSDGNRRPLAEYERIVREFVQPSLAGHSPWLVLATDRGAVRIVLDGVQTPMTADNFSTLARAGYFNGLRFHRVVPAFVAQGGDPRGDGSGGPGFSIRDELNRTRYVRGAVGMALSGPDTGGSQFFLTLAPQPHLDGHYTVFGRVVTGQRAMDALVQGGAIHSIATGPR